MARGKPRTKSSNNVSRQEFVALKRSLHGYNYTPPSDPPKKVVRPWMQQSLDIFLTGSQIITADSLLKAFIDNSGIPTLQVGMIELRVKSASVWGRSTLETTNLSKSLDVNFFSLLADQLEPLSTLNDTGGTVTRARVGFTWPAAHSSAPISSTDAKWRIVQVTDDCQVRVHVMWRFHSPEAARNTPIKCTLEEVTGCASAALTSIHHR